MDLNIGDKIELIYEKEIYKSKVQDISGETGLTVSNPIAKGYYVYIPVDSALIVRFYKENACYQFFSSLVSKSDLNGLRALNLDIVSNVEKIQRRKYYRIELALPIMYKRCEEKEYKRAIMKDISGGGIKISLDTVFKRGEKIDLKINIDKMKIKICGVVIRVSKNKRIYDLGIEFDDVDRINREKIIKFIFKKQRERIKRG